MDVRALGALLALVAAGAGGGHVERRTVVLGRSLEGRPIAAVEISAPGADRVELVVGCIHGNEGAGIDVAQRLEALVPPRRVDLWIVPDLNPDGHARGTRGNARGVDLNRNFPWHWQRLAGVYFSGPHALSEPESRLAYRLIVKLRPRVSIWFHQHLQLVDESGGDPAVERRFSRLSGLPLRKLSRYPGSVVSWENARLAGTSAFVVELPAGRLSAADADRYARAALAVAPG